MIIGRAIKNESLVKGDISIKGVVAEKNDSRINNMRNLNNTSNGKKAKLNYTETQQKTTDGVYITDVSEVVDNTRIHLLPLSKPDNYRNHPPATYQ